MTSQLLWFATRGAGVVSLLLFTVVVCLGVLTVLRWQTEDWPRFLTAELHRSLALLSVVFVTMHIVTAIVDPFTSLGLVAAVIPFASSYRPLWVGLQDYGGLRRARRLRRGGKNAENHKKKRESGSN